MPLKKLGKPPFLNAKEVENDDVVEIVDQPYIVGAEESKWGRERGRVVVKLVDKNGEVQIRTWTLNVTSWDRLIDAFGTDGKLWIGKKLRIRKETQMVRGEERPVLYAFPYQDPQQPLVKPSNASDQQIVDLLKKLPAEQKAALLETLKGT